MSMSVNDQGNQILSFLALPVFQGLLLFNLFLKILLTIKTWLESHFLIRQDSAVINEFSVTRSDGTVIDGFITEVFHDRDMDGVKDETASVIKC